MKISIVLDSEKVEKIIHKPSAIIGRSKNCDFRIEVESLSREHCQVDFVEGKFYITDLNSANGVFIDGIKIPPLEKVPYTTVLPLLLGNLEFKISDEEVTFSAYKIPPEKRRVERLTPPTTQRKVFENPSKTKKEASSTFLLFVLSLLLLLPLGYFLSQGLEESPKASSENPAKATHLRPGKFLSLGQYLEASSNKGCDKNFINVCKALSIFGVPQEGIFASGSVWLIYFRAHRPSLKDIFFDESTRADTIGLAALHFFLGSDVLSELKKNEVKEVHLILLNEHGNIGKVFRLSPADLSSRQTSKVFLDKMEKALKEGKAPTFLKKHRGLFPSKDYYRGL